MKKFLYVLGTILVVLAIYVTFFSPSQIPFSPLGPDSNIIHNLQAKKYVILGFAPYWNLKKLTPDSLSHITHFAYFHLLLNGDGSLYTKVNRREEDPSFTNYKRLLSGTIDYGAKPLIITFMPESQTALTSMISSKSSRSNTINTILNTLKESRASGVNIDFEPLGDTPVAVRNNFSLFIQELKLGLKSSSHNQLSISVYGSAGSNPRIWDLRVLSEYTDYFVVMTYDYTMPGANSSGPNAPLRGSGVSFEHDIIKNIAEITNLVPPDKVLLGIPFYGYEWDTVDASKYSPTEAKGSMASLERIQKMLDDKTLELIWDRNTLTPYGIASNSGQISQIYFENETSIKLKIQFVKSAGLGGIAIWALGYEGNNAWIWPTIKDLSQ